MNIGMLKDPLVKEELNGVAEKEKDEIINFEDWLNFKKKIQKWAKGQSRERKIDRILLCSKT